MSKHWLNRLVSSSRGRSRKNPGKWRRRLFLEGLETRRLLAADTMLTIDAMNRMDAGHDDVGTLGGPVAEVGQANDNTDVPG